MTLAAGAKVVQTYESEQLLETIQSGEGHFEVKDDMFGFRYMELEVVAR